MKNWGPINPKVITGAVSVFISTPTVAKLIGDCGGKGAILAAVAGGAVAFVTGYLTPGPK